MNKTFEMKKYILFSKTYIIVNLFCLLLTSCQTKKNSSKVDSPISSKFQLPDRPNILWLVTKNIKPYIPPFNDSTIQTPNLSRLTTEDVIYPNIYSPSNIYAPSKTAIVTKMYPSSIGANHIHTNSYTEVTGLPTYETIPQPKVKIISELLRTNSYYYTNNSKTDYQFTAPITA